MPSLKKQLKGLLAKIETNLDEENRGKVKDDLHRVLDLLKDVQRPEEKIVTVVQRIEPPKPADPNQSIIQENVRLRADAKQLRKDIDLIFDYWLQDKICIGDRLVKILAEQGLMRRRIDFGDDKSGYALHTSLAEHRRHIMLMTTECKAAKNHAVWNENKWVELFFYFESLFLRYKGKKLSLDKVPDIDMPMV